MTDGTINRYIGSGTQAQRLAFTPNPGTPVSGPSPLCIFYETDTGYTYLSASGGPWVRVNDGLPWKPDVRAATTTALATNTYSNGTSGVGATLTATANGALAAQDGVALVAGDRLLVKNEATGANNGIYVVTQLGDASHPYILTRATDADAGAELVNAVCKISEGTTLADQEWQCTTNATITVGTTALKWAQAGGSGGISALTGDVTASGSGSVAATLAASGVTASTYGDATHVPQIAVDAKGRITSASNVAISGGGGGGNTYAFPHGDWSGMGRTVRNRARVAALGNNQARSGLGCRYMRRLLGATVLRPDLALSAQLAPPRLHELGGAAGFLSLVGVFLFERGWCGFRFRLGNRPFRPSGFLVRCDC